jgi:hypothetical protein
VATFATVTPKHLGQDEMNNYNEFYPFDPSYPYLVKNRNRNNNVIQYFDPADITDKLDSTKMTYTLPGQGNIIQTRRSKGGKAGSGHGKHATQYHDKIQDISDIFGLPEEVLQQIQSSGNQRKMHRDPFISVLTDEDEMRHHKRGVPMDDASIFNLDSFIMSNRQSHKGREEFHDVFMTPEF